MRHHPYADGNGEGRFSGSLSQSSGDLLLWPLSGMDFDKMSWELFVFQKNDLEKMGIFWDAGVFNCFDSFWNFTQYFVE